MSHFFRVARNAIGRPDVRRNPLRALFKWATWRLRWKFTSRLWELELKNGMRIATHMDGPGSFIYYYGGFSEPTNHDFFTRFLTSGKVVFDIGAHIGEYSLLSSGLVGANGRVHAFEPQPDMFSLLQSNIKLNGLTNIAINNQAVSSTQGTVHFEVFASQAVSGLKSSNPVLDQQPVQILEVESITLDDYWKNSGCGLAHLLKIDVEGAEWLVLKGAEALLGQEPSHSPVILFEYLPENYQRFGYSSSELITWLTERGYSIMEYRKGGFVVPLDAESIQQHKFQSPHLLASKRPLTF